MKAVNCLLTGKVVLCKKAMFNVPPSPNLVQGVVPTEVLP